MTGKTQEEGDLELHENLVPKKINKSLKIKQVIENIEQRINHGNNLSKKNFNAFLHSK